MKWKITNAICATLTIAHCIAFLWIARWYFPPETLRWFAACSGLGTIALLGFLFHVFWEPIVDHYLGPLPSASPAPQNHGHGIHPRP